MTKIILAAGLVAFMVNTEAGSFRCAGPIVVLDAKGVPSSGERGGTMIRCDLVVSPKEAI